MATVVLDAGHGGFDFGAVNEVTGRREKDDNLRMALAVRGVLQGRGQRVVMTRDSDVFVSLAERVRISNNSNADMFVSIHRNSFYHPAANGVESFVKIDPTSREVAYASNVLGNIVRAGVQSNRGLKQADFYVLVYTNAPSQLVELGFVSNAEDNRLFDVNFMPYAEAIADGIMTSLGLPIAPPPPTGDNVVKAIQQTLNTIYDSALVADGIAGPLTRRALIRALQLQLNSDYDAKLVPDGIFGSFTRGAIRPLRQGDRGNLVWILQAALYINGFRTTPDGIFGPNTAATVRAFQSARGLTVDGIAGQNTFERLMRT